MMTAATAQSDDDEESEVTVDVSSEVALDVRPTELSYSAETGEQVPESDDGFTTVEIENIGSEDIGEIWAGSSDPMTEPFGTGDASNYDTGNFVQLAVETANTADYDDINDAISDSNTDPHYAQRMEYQEDPAPTYIQTDDAGTFEAEEDDVVDATDLEETEIGRFRAGELEYFYVIYHGSEGCEGSDANSDAALVVGNTAHTPNQVGTSDFTADGNDYTVFDLADHAINDNYGVAEGITLEVDDETREYNTLLRCDGGDDSHTVRTRFNPLFNGDEVTSGEQRYIFQTSTEDNALNPGASFPLDINSEIPLGVVEGQIQEGTLTVFANEFTS